MVTSELTAHRERQQRGRDGVSFRASCVIVLVPLVLASCARIIDPSDDAAPSFGLLPVGTALPSDEQCARDVPRDDWEPVPQNAERNLTRGAGRLPAHPDFDDVWQDTYLARVTGDFIGTTDEIIQWTACKWGLDADMLRAQAFRESGWDMAAEGDWEPRSSALCAPGDLRDPCPTSFGIMQNKWFYNPGSYPALTRSTAWHLDFSAAKLRGCFDGHKWIDGEKPHGDIWGCVGNWWSGAWYDDGAAAYIEAVREHHEARSWRAARG